MRKTGNLAIQLVFDCDVEHGNSTLVQANAKLFYERETLQQEESHNINGTKIKVVDSVEYLGITLSPIT